MMCVCNQQHFPQTQLQAQHNSTVNLERLSFTNTVSVIADEVTAPFQSKIAPNEMRQLALIAHNHMKPAMKQFIETYSQILKKFRIAGTQTTIDMCKSMWGEDDPSIHYGLTCKSGPLGGDAQIAALMSMNDLGGIIFFVDPLSAHPHEADIDSLLRLANCGNIIVCANPTSASSMMCTLKMALLDEDRAHGLIPSFFETLESPAVEEYKHQQAVALAKVINETPSSEYVSTSRSTADAGTQANDAMAEQYQHEPTSQARPRPALSDSLVHRALMGQSLVIRDGDFQGEALRSLLLGEQANSEDEDDPEWDHYEESSCDNDESELTESDSEHPLSQSAVDSMYDRALMKQSVVSNESNIDLHTMSTVYSNDDDEDDDDYSHIQARSTPKGDDYENEDKDDESSLHHQVQPEPSSCFDQFPSKLTAPFQSKIAPTEMRQLALIAHNHMKPAEAIH